MPMIEIEDENNIEECELCYSKEKNVLRFGKAYKLENCLVHHFCLLFASALPQNGQDSEGILGFLQEDLEKEIVRGKKVQCNYCQKKGATIGCVQTKCKRSFHYQCSLENNGLFQFFDTFPAWCSEHRPVQSVFMQESPEEKAQRSCGICLELISGQTPPLWAPCCGGFFDSQCVSKLAATSGYFFKCPLCNNKDVFNIEMKKFGIHVPEQDADWENEPGAYSALLERYTHCDAELCSCEDGRNYDEDDTIYEIILCQSCGSSGIHIQCGKLKLSDPVFLCNTCKGPEMVKEEKENGSGRRKSLRGKPSDAEPTNTPRKLQLEKVIKSPSPSKNPRKNKCSLPNLEESIKSENAVDEPIAKQGIKTPQPVDNKSKPRRGRRKLLTEEVEEPKGDVIPVSEIIQETVISELSSQEKRGRKRKVIEQPNKSLESSKEETLNIKTTSKEKTKRGRKKEFVLLADTRQPDKASGNVIGNGIKDATSESSQHIAEEDILGPGGEASAFNSDENSVLEGKSEAPEEELDTELFDLASQINFNFEIPSSPLRPAAEVTPSKLKTPLKNPPTKKLPKKNLIEEISLSPLKETRRGRVRTPRSTPLKETAVVKDTNEKLSESNCDVPNSTRRSGRKNEQVHETKQVSKCALNFSKAGVSEVQDTESNIKDQELLAKEIGLNKSMNENCQNPSEELNNDTKTEKVSKELSFIKEAEPHNGETSRSIRGSRKRDCTSIGQSQTGALPKPCKEKENKETPTNSKKPLVIKLGVKDTRPLPNTSPNDPVCKSQSDTSTNPVSKLSDADLRKNRLEHAKIRVKINELMDKLDSALASKDYGAAEVVKTGLEALKVTQKHLEDVANCAASDLKHPLNPEQTSLPEIKKAITNLASPPSTNCGGGKRKRTEIINEPTVIAEQMVSHERTSKRLRTKEQPIVPSIHTSNNKKNDKIEEIKGKVTVTVTESPSKTRTKGPVRNTAEKKGADADLIENNQNNSELNHSISIVPSKDRAKSLEVIEDNKNSKNIKTLIFDWEETSEETGKNKPRDLKNASSSCKEKTVHSHPQNLNENAHSLEITPTKIRQRNAKKLNNKIPDIKSQSTTGETPQIPSLSRSSPRKSANNTLNIKKNKDEDQSSQRERSINKSFPKLEDIRLHKSCVNLFNINSSQLVKSIHKKKTKRIILHLNKYLINTSGRTHSKKILLKAKVDQSIGEMSDELTSMKTEISKIIAQDKLRENTKIILHLNLKAKTVRIEKIKKDQKKNVRKSGRSRKEAEKKPPEAKQSKAKNDVLKTKSQKIITKAVPKTKSRSQKQRERTAGTAGTAPYPYASETTLEEELFYQICPLKPTSQPKSVHNQSSGRIGEKKNNTRRILISMQKLGRSPILDRPLSFVAFTFDGSNLISHETVDELKERTFKSKRTISKKSDNNDSKIKSKVKRSDNNDLKNKSKVKLSDNDDSKNKTKVSINKHVRILKTQNIIRKKKVSIWKSSKLNSRIKTMISKNGTIQMTVNKEITSEVPNGLNVSKYFKIRRTSSFSPASHKSTSPTSRNESLTEIQKDRDLQMKKPVVPQLISEKNDQNSTSLEEDTVISPMKIKIPKDLWVQAKEDKRLLKLEKKQASVKQRSNVKPKTVKVKYKNLYGRVIEYAKNLPRKN